MYTVLLSIHILVTIFLVGIILVQRSATDSTGLSGSSNTSFMSGRAAASFLTHTTAVLAACFIFTSLGLGIIASRGHTAEGSIVDRLGATTPPAATAPALPTPAPAKQPVKPTVPRPE